MTRNANTSETTCKVKKDSADNIFRRYSSALHGFIKKQLSSEDDDSEDLLHDIFYRFFSTNEDIENISAWLYRTARNLIIDRSRKKKEERMPYISQEDETFPISDILLLDDNTPETILAQQIIEEEISAALDRLPDEQRNVYELNEIQGIQFSEISEATGIPINTLISRKRYAVQYLRKELEYLYSNR